MSGLHTEITSFEWKLVHWLMYITCLVIVNDNANYGIVDVTVYC